MIIAKIHVNGVQASVKACQRIPVGAVGLKLQIDYDGDAWAGLSKTVVFRGCVTKDVVDAGTEVTIPPEVIADCGNSLQVGIYGINSAGSLVIPTLWADLGRVYYAADPSGDETTEDTLPVWAQLQAEISALKGSGGGNPAEDGTFELIESITVADEGLSVIERTAEPDGTAYNLSAATLILKVYDTAVMFGTQVIFYNGNNKLGLLLENIPAISYAQETFYSACIYHARPRAGVYEFVSAYGQQGGMMDIHYPNNAEWQTVDTNNKITKIVFSLWNGTTIPVGTVIEIYGVRA